MSKHDAWKPTVYGGRYYMTTDMAAYPEGKHGPVELLTSEDGERWSRVCEIIRGSEELPLPTEVAVCFLDDGQAVAVIRDGMTSTPRTALATSDPPYDKWEYKIIPLTLKTPEIARVGDYIVMVGRCLDEEGEYEGNLELWKHMRTGVFLCEDGELKLGALLPSGEDTGSPGMLPLSESEFLVAYYSGHEYTDSEREQAKERLVKKWKENPQENPWRDGKISKRLSRFGPTDIYLASISLRK